MIKDGGLSFKTQFEIEFLAPNNGTKKCLEKSLTGLYNENLPKIYSDLSLNNYCDLSDEDCDLPRGEDLDKSNVRSALLQMKLLNNPFLIHISAQSCNCVISMKS